MKNNAYRGIINGVGYFVDRDRSYTRGHYQSYLIVPSGYLYRHLTKRDPLAMDSSDLDKMDELREVKLLRKEFAGRWSTVTGIQFREEFDTLLGASSFAKSMCEAIKSKKKPKSNPAIDGELPTKNLTEMLNDVTLAGPIFKSKEKTDEFLKKVKDDLNSRYGTMSEKIVEVNKAKSELNSVYGRKAFLSGPVPWDKLNTMEIQFDGMGGALVKFRNRFIALLMVNDILYISNDVITFNSEYVQPWSWSTTNPDGSGITVEISFDPDPNFTTGYIKLKRTK